MKIILNSRKYKAMTISVWDYWYDIQTNVVSENTRREIPAEISNIVIVL